MESVRRTGAVTHQTKLDAQNGQVVAGNLERRGNCVGPTHDLVTVGLVQCMFAPMLLQKLVGPGLQLSSHRRQVRLIEDRVLEMELVAGIACAYF